MVCFQIKWYDPGQSKIMFSITSQSISILNTIRRHFRRNTFYILGRRNTTITGSILYMQIINKISVDRNGALIRAIIQQFSTYHKQTKRGPKHRLKKILWYRETFFPKKFVEDPAENLPRICKWAWVHCKKHLQSQRLIIWSIQWCFISQHFRCSRIWEK